MRKDHALGAVVVKHRFQNGCLGFRRRRRAAVGVHRLAQELFFLLRGRAVGDLDVTLGDRPLVATAGVVFFGVLEGILIAVVLSILLFFRRNWWPHGELLGQLDDQTGWHSHHNSSVTHQLPGIVVYRWEAPLFFANAGMFREQVRALVREHKPRWVVLQCEAITDIDVTAADVLEQLDLELNAQGVNIAFVELRSRLKDLVYDYGLFATLDAEHFYLSIDEALADIGRQAAEEHDT